MSNSILEKSIEQQIQELTRINSDCMIANNYDYNLRKQLEENLRIYLIEKNGNRYNIKCDYCQTDLFYLDRYSDQYRKILNDEINRLPDKSLIIWEINDNSKEIGDKLACNNCLWKNEKAQEDQQLIETLEKHKRLKKSKPLRKLIKPIYKCPICEIEKSSKLLIEIHLSDHDSYEIEKRIELLERYGR